VQYAELYQIFRHYDVDSKAEHPKFQSDPPPVFVATARKLITQFAKEDDDRIRANFRGAADDLVACRQVFAAIEDELGNEGVDELAQALAAPRLFQRELQAKGISPREKSGEAAILNAAFRCQRLGHMLPDFGGLNRDDLRRAYVAAKDRETTGWVRTPSIVISRAVGDVAGTVGGHNLNAAITEFRTSAQVAKGKVKVIEEDGKRILLANPDDSGKVQAAVRSIGRAEQSSTADIEEKAAAELARAKPDSRPVPEVLAFNGAHAPEANRGFQTDLASPAVGDSGWWLAKRRITPSQTKVAEALQSNHLHGIVIERTSDGHYLVFDGPSRRMAQASTQPAATDAVLAYLDPHTKGLPVRLHLRGFEPREASGFARSTELQLASFREPPELAATVEAADIPAERLKAFLTEEYNFREVKIKDISEPVVTAEGETRVDIDAEIAAVKPGRPSLLVRITVFLRQGVQMTAQLLSAIRLHIETAFSRGTIYSASDNTLILTHAFVKSLERVNPDIKYVEMKVTKEGSDLRIVLNHDPRSGKSSHAG